MIRLCDLIRSDNVFLGVALSSKKRVFEQASQTFALLCGLDQKEVFNALINREKIGSTYLGQGVSLPHGRIAGLETPRAVFIRLQEGVCVGSNDEVARNLFFLAVPEESTDDHLSILAQVASILTDKETSKELDEAATSEIFCNLVTTWCETHSTEFA